MASQPNIIPGRFDGKVLLVTGSASSSEGELMGFGGATTWRFLREGGKAAVLTDVRDERGERSARSIRDAGFTAEFVRHDVTSESDWETVVGGVVERHGRLDYLVNIAGTQDTTSIEDTPVDKWQQVMDVTSRGMFLGVKHAARAMKANGKAPGKADAGGAIVNLSSMAARWASPYGAAYAASRAGMTHFTRGAAIQYAADGIRVNSVLPGWVKSPFTEWIFTDEKLRKYRTDRVPLGRWGEPSEIAAAILFLLSDDASYITGSELLIDGGVTAGFFPPVGE
ncbi:MAG: SDR family oxidoreductase [Chloroflexi bacterium]|nr:SDR family oxidoreductase [Chloroflexota bacterium]MDA1296659.1 SDR family oxidoreductase [Chloroflexota bacterium]